MPNRCHRGDRQPTIENSQLSGKISGGLYQITRAGEVDHNLPCPLVLAYNCNVLVGEAAQFAEHRIPPIVLGCHANPVTRCQGRIGVRHDVDVHSGFTLAGNGQGGRCVDFRTLAMAKGRYPTLPVDQTA